MNRRSFLQAAALAPVAAVVPAAFAVSRVPELPYLCVEYPDGSLGPNLFEQGGFDSAEWAIGTGWSVDQPPHGVTKEDIRQLFAKIDGCIEAQAEAA